MLTGGLRARPDDGVLSPGRADEDGWSVRGRSAYSLCLSHTQSGGWRTGRHLGNIGGRTIDRVNARRSGTPSSHTGNCYTYGWNDVTESTATIRSPFCGYNMAQCVEIRGEELSCYLNKIPSVGLWKCLYVHYLANEAYFSAITVKNIYESFTHKMAAKPRWHWNYVTVTQCISILIGP